MEACGAARISSFSRLGPGCLPWPLPFRCPCRALAHHRPPFARGVRHTAASHLRTSCLNFVDPVLLCDKRNRRYARDSRLGIFSTRAPSQQTDSDRPLSDDAHACAPWPPTPRLPARILHQSRPELPRYARRPLSRRTTVRSTRPAHTRARARRPQR